ncbi:MAG TPA: glycosyltransferase [Longimicrobium sp.]
MVSFSAIIPCRDSAPFIRRALRSVAAQTVAAGEVILVDDGSVDGTAEIAERTGIPTRIVRARFGNAALARNLGAEQATGEWLAFLDADDVWYPHHLARAAAVLGEGGTSAHLARVDYVDASSRVVRTPDPWHVAGPVSGLSAADCIRLWLRDRNFDTLSSVLVSRRRFREIGGFDRAQTCGHDFEMWLRAIHSRSWSYDPEPTALYTLMRPGGLTAQSVARSQLFVARGFIQNTGRYGGCPGYPRLVQAAARRALAAALSSGTRGDVRRARGLAAPHLRPRDRLVFESIGRFPLLFRLVLAATRRLRGALRPRGRPAWPRL